MPTFVLRSIGAALVLAIASSLSARAQMATPPAEVDLIAFGSCAKQNRPQPVWDQILSHRPDLFLFIGDNIYADTTDLDVVRAKYAELGSKPEFQRFRAATPILATWDDHDYGKNDAGAEFPVKDGSKLEFMAFFGVPESSPMRTRGGVYDAHVFGPEGRRVQVILLDTRYFRSPLERWPKGTKLPTNGRYRPSYDPDATMLGEAQWAWLEEQLRAPADVRIIASSIQVAAQEHGYEMWGNLPRERDRLVRLIADTGAEGVVFISGDRHLTEISRIPADTPGGPGYPLYDITSSELSRQGGGYIEEPNSLRTSPGNYNGVNFGLIRIDWSRPEPEIRLQSLDETNKILFEQRLPLGLLQPQD